MALARTLQRQVPPLDLRPGFGRLPAQLGGLVPALTEAEAEATALQGALDALNARGGDGPPEEGAPATPWATGGGLECACPEGEAAHWNLRSRS